MNLRARGRIGGPTTRAAVEQLRQQWMTSGERLEERMAGLLDDEFYWEPVVGCWTLRAQPGLGGRVNIDYEVPVPEPTPVTTIAWRLVHLANGNWIYWEHAFGPGRLMFPDLDPPASANKAIQYWKDSRVQITGWLERATDPDLRELRPSHLGSPRTAGDVLLILIDEQVHHGAEIGLLRDLYPWWDSLK